MNRHIGKVITLERTSDGELVASIDLATGGWVHKLPNTVSNFAMDEEVLLVVMRRADADIIFDNLSSALEPLEDDYGIDDRTWKFVEMLKPDELPPWEQKAKASFDAGKMSADGDPEGYGSPNAATV